MEFSILQQHGETALHIAASKGFTGIVSLLIVRGSNLHHRNEHGSTPLVVAFFHNRIDVAIVLIEAGTDVSIRTKVSEWLLSRVRCLYYTFFLDTWQDGRTPMEFISSSKLRLQIEVSTGLQHFYYGLLHRQ